MRDHTFKPDGQLDQSRDQANELSSSQPDSKASRSNLETRRAKSNRPQADPRRVGFSLRSCNAV